MLDEKIVSESAEKWGKFYAIRRDAFAHKDVADLLNQYGVSSEDAGRLMAALNVLTAKDVAKRMGGRK